MNVSKIASTLFLITGAGLGLSSACTIHKYEAPPPGSTAAPTAAPTAATDAATSPPSAYNPCAGKNCGDACTICDPNDKACAETAVVKQCSAALACEPSPAQCGAAPAPTATTPPPTTTYDACAGKKCGDRCKICAPTDIKCIESALIKLCHPDGKCKEATSVDCTKK